jgi:hypothetical protein
MTLHLFEYVTGIVGKVEWDTFILSVMVSHLASFGTVAPKDGVFYMFKQVSSLKALIIDVVTAKFFWIISCTCTVSRQRMNCHMHYDIFLLSISWLFL